jgi:hypothetical protein
MADFELVTPETHPGHHTVGQDFLGWDGGRYYCDSYDPRCGYWMTPLGEPTRERRNVSERAISRTYHIVWLDTCWPNGPREFTTEGFMMCLRRWQLSNPELHAERLTRAGRAS